MDPRLGNAPAAPARRAWVPAVVLLALAAQGCGKKGNPLPPEPRGPLAPRGVMARQIGSRVEVSLQLTNPRGPKPSQQPVRAELMRVDFVPGVTPPAGPEVFRRRGDLVDVREGDPLDAGALLRMLDGLEGLPEGGVGRILRYAVRAIDRRGRPSPWVVAPDLVPLASAAAPLGLAGTATADGIRLVWQPPPGVAEDTGYNLYRWERSAAGAVAPVNTSPVTATEYLDGEVEIGKSYRYLVRAALAPGRPFREGESSAVVDVVAEDRFAPGVPGGLVAVQEGMAVRLFWDPSPERDLEGYLVYRRVEDGAWRSIVAAPLGASLHLDPDVAAGQHLAYRVTAVDRADPPNESEPSEMVEVDVGSEPAGERP